MTQPRRLSPGTKDIVIVGCGGVGAAVAARLAELGHLIHILDVDTRAFDHLPENRVADGHITPLAGNGTFETDLTRAGISEADALVALTGQDSTNALSAQLAAQVFAVESAICRIDDPARQQTYNDLGLTAISATVLLADSIVDSITD